MNNDDVKHDGHRKRLVDLAYNAGIENLSNIQLVELMLTFIFPRGDVNPLAHRLLDTYGNLNNIFEADVNEMMSIKGINDRSAKRIKLLRDLLSASYESKVKSPDKPLKISDIVTVLEDLLKHQTTENIVFLGFNKNGRLSGQKRMRALSADAIGVPILEITGFFSSIKPVTFVISHCHPHGSATPSDQDYQAYEMVGKLCDDCGIKLVDSFIVGIDGVFSFKEGKFVREYLDSEIMDKYLL